MDFEQFKQDLFRTHFVSQIIPSKPWCVWVRSKHPQTHLVTYIIGDFFRWRWTANIYASLVETVLGRSCIVQENSTLLQKKSS